MNHLRVMLKTLKEHQLSAKHRKFELWLRSVTFLVHIISSEEVEVDPIKTEAVKNWPRPLTRNDIWILLGLAGYYRWFVNVFDLEV